MKKLLTLLLLTSGAGFAGQSLPEFSTKLDLDTSFSLSDATKAGQLTQFQPGLPSQRPSKPARKLISRMPVIEATDLVDRNMPIAKPDPEVDYSMVVKEPEVVFEK